MAKRLDDEDTARNDERNERAERDGEREGANLFLRRDLRRRLTGAQAVETERELATMRLLGMGRS